MENKKINLISKPEKVDYLGKAPWDRKKLKKIMTDLAAGHISKKEAESLIKEKKVAGGQSDKESKDKSKHTQTRLTKCREDKK